MEQKKPEGEPESIESSLNDLLRSHYGKIIIYSEKTSICLLHLLSAVSSEIT